MNAVWIGETELVADVASATDTELVFHVRRDLERATRVLSGLVAAPQRPAVTTVVDGSTRVYDDARRVVVTEDGVMDHTLRLRVGVIE
jgi:hypothetical protein